MQIENIFAEIEFDEELYVLGAIKEHYGETTVKISSTKWVEDGKYRFESFLIVETPDLKHLRFTLSMFGNNPRDDFQYVKVVKIETVKRVEKITYVWESV